jgi:hypothetical protein
VKMRTLALLGGLGWAYSKGPRDPQAWPGFLAEQYAVVRGQIDESIAAGKRASVRRGAQIDREIDEVLSRTVNRRR